MLGSSSSGCQWEGRAPDRRPTDDVCSDIVVARPRHAWVEVVLADGGDGVGLVCRQGRVEELHEPLSIRCYQHKKKRVKDKMSY